MVTLHYSYKKVSVLSPHFLLPTQNYHANVALTLQPYFYHNRTFFVCGRLCTAVPSLRLRSLSGFLLLHTETYNFVTGTIVTAFLAFAVIDLSVMMNTRTELQAKQ